MSFIATPLDLPVFFYLVDPVIPFLEETGDECSVFIIDDCDNNLLGAIIIMGR